MGFVFGKRSKEKLIGVHPKLVDLMNKSIETSPYDFAIDYGVRDVATQQKLYSYGRTVVNPNTGPINGNKFGMQVTTRDGVKRRSNHQTKSDGFGYAVDIYPYYNGSLQTKDQKTLKLIIDHVKKTAKELGIACSFGIDWKNPYDPPHIELK